MTKRFGVLAGVCAALICASSALAQESENAASGKAQTGPLAFGFINMDGSTASGSGNFKSSLVSNTYHIKIKKTDYFFSSFATSVTPVLPGISYCTTSSVSGDLLVNCFDATGNQVAAAFGFVTF
jgi:uncharacterized membrane protein YeiH